MTPNLAVIACLQNRRQGDLSLADHEEEAGTEAVFFSPADELAKPEAVMMKNMQAMQAG